MEFVGIEKQLFEASGHGNLQLVERQDVAQVDGQSGRMPVSEHLAPYPADTP